MNLSQADRAAYPKLTAALAPKNETLQHYLHRKGIADPKVRSTKWHNAQQAKRSPGQYKYPDWMHFKHQMLVEAQGPLWTFNAPDCVGDGQQFSSPGLTQWYVESFCKANHLKGRH